MNILSDFPLWTEWKSGRFIIALPFFLLAVLFTGGKSIAAGDMPQYHPNVGLFEPWQCAFEREHVPPLEPEAERMFLRAREIQRKPYPSGEEKEEAFNLYKQASKRNHWRAMANLASCYAEGYGTQPSITSADDVYNDMMKRGIPMGFYGKYLLTAHGRGVPQDRVEAMRLLHKAANTGNPQAQYRLGEYYIYREDRLRQGLAYHVCATRQGHAESAHAIEAYLKIEEENYLMAAEYYLREAALGGGAALLSLSATFDPENKFSGEGTTLGFAGNTELKNMFYSLWEKYKKDKTLKFPELLKFKLPKNTLMSREKSRSMPSSLRLPDGRWPDEVFPEFDPDYVQPRY